MQFEDELPCGGYQKEDNQIKQAMQTISLGTQQGTLNNASQSCDSCDCNPLQKSQSNSCGYPPISTKTQSDQANTLNSATKPNQNYTKTPLCKKCQQNFSSLMHKNDPICKPCLLKNIEYKCRLSLQNKLKIKATDPILVCFSGGLNSIALVTIIKNLKRRYKKSPLFGQVRYIHIQQQKEIPQGYTQRFQDNVGQKIDIVSIWEIFEDESDQKGLEDVKKVLQGFKVDANSADLLEIFRDRLIQTYAKRHNIKYILKGNNCQNLATQVFKNFTKGKGGNIPDFFNPTQLAQLEILFFYPLRQHLQKQLQFYFHSEKLSTLSLKSSIEDLSHLVSASIDNHLIRFISNLQQMYSHTSPAIVRTAQKLESNRFNQRLCAWCMEKGVLEELGKQQKARLCLRCLRIWEGRRNNLGIKNWPQWMKQPIITDESI